jgi:hypothetical protein
MAQPQRYENSAHRQAAYRQRTARLRAEQLQARSLPPLPAVPGIPGWTRWRGLLGQAHWSLRQTVTEMEQYAQERSETWQESERGENFEERLGAVQELLDAVEAFAGEYDLTLPTST